MYAEGWRGQEDTGPGRRRPDATDLPAIEGMLESWTGATRFRRPRIRRTAGVIGQVRRYRRPVETRDERSSFRTMTARRRRGGILRDVLVEGTADVEGQDAARSAAVRGRWERIEITVRRGERSAISRSSARRELQVHVGLFGTASPPQVVVVTRQRSRHACEIEESRGAGANASSWTADKPEGIEEAKAVAGFASTRGRI